MGNIILKSVEYTTSVEATYLGVGVSNLTLATIERDYKERLSLQERYEKVMEAYNKEFQKRIELENKVMG